MGAPRVLGPSASLLRVEDTVGIDVGLELREEGFAAGMRRLAGITLGTN